MQTTIQSFFGSQTLSSPSTCLLLFSLFLTRRIEKILPNSEKKEFRVKRIEWLERESERAFTSRVMRKRKHCLVFRVVACQARQMRVRGWIVSAFAKGQKQLPAYVRVSADDMYCNLRPHIREAKCFPIGFSTITWLNCSIWLVKEMPFWTRGWPISCPFELCPPTQETTIRSKNTFFSSKRPFQKRIKWVKAVATKVPVC